MPATRPVHTKRTRCRACDEPALEMFLPLGEVALANSFLRSDAEIPGEKRFPLEVYFCRTCSMVQLADVIAPEVLFENYLYVTGTSDTIAAHNVGYAQAVVDLLGLGSEDLVVEIASNDGSLLKRFQDHGVRTLGVEPAKNIAEAASADGVETMNRFWPEAAPDLLAGHGRAKAVIGNNVLAHVDAPVDFLAGARSVLAPGGRVITEVPQLREFVERLEYDTVYHEHLSYFSVTSLMRVCEEAGLRIVQVDEVPVHGGSVRMIAASDEEHPDHAPAVHAAAADEAALGLASLERFQRFARDVAKQKRDLLELLRSLKAEGKTVAGYGAPAKGNTMLNYCGITTDLVPYTVDKSPLKVGLLTPGQHIPVLETKTLLERQPDYVLILAWNFADEIMRQQAEYANRGGCFILPLPTPRVV